MTTTPAIIITYPYPLGNFNGGARMTREIATHIGQQGIPVYLIAVSFKFNESFPRQDADEEVLGLEFDDQLAEVNVHVIRVKSNIFDRYLDGLGVLRVVKQLVAEKPISAVLSYYYEGAFLPRFLKRKKIPFGIIATWQSYERAMKMPSKFRKPLKYSITYIKKWLIRYMYQRAERLFASSDHSGKELTKFLGVKPERIETCYLGVSPAFANLPRPKPEKINRFLFFGRIIKSKGVADAIQALGKLAANGHQDWRFDIYGQGFSNWAKSIIAAEGLEDKISIHGPLFDHKLHEVLIDAHLAILPSHIEAFGLAFAESQAAGLPIIGYTAGGMQEIVIHGRTGWLAPIHNIDQLAAYLVQAIENPEQTYQRGLAGRERVKALFTWERTADTILKGINQIAKQPLH